MTLFRTVDESIILGGKDIISKEELRKQLKISMSTIQRMMLKGMPFTRFQNYVGFSTSAVDKWLHDNGYADANIVANFKSEQKARSAKKKEVNT